MAAQKSGSKELDKFAIGIQKIDISFQEDWMAFYDNHLCLVEFLLMMDVSINFANRILFKLLQ